MFGYSRGLLKVRGGGQLLGALHCTRSYGAKVDPADSVTVYDLAGRSIESWIAPLTVPDYSIKPGERLILGPST